MVELGVVQNGSDDTWNIARINMGGMMESLPFPLALEPAPLHMCLICLKLASIVFTYPRHLLVNKLHMCTLIHGWLVVVKWVKIAHLTHPLSPIHFHPFHALFKVVARRDMHPNPLLNRPFYMVREATALVREKVNTPFSTHAYASPSS